jgi:rRNA-processing protein FCF1
MVVKVKAFISLNNEHGLFVKDGVFEGLSNSDFVIVRFPITSKYIIERISNFSELNLEEESKMLISLFDALASQHYYFLSEFEFTEKVEWKPKQYDFLSKLNPYFDINKGRREYKAFKELYNLVENLFLDFTMSLRSNGKEPYELFVKRDEEFVGLLEGVSNLFMNEIANAYTKADVVIGCGTFISLADFPVDLAFQYSGFDVGELSYTSTKKLVTVNPFIFYWLITSFFQCKNGTAVPSYIPIEINNIPPTVQFSNVKELKIRTYNPSEKISKVFISKKGIEFIIENLRDTVFSHNPIVHLGEFLTPFTSPSVVLEVDTEETEEDLPFVQSTPYGQVIYEQFALPKIVDKTQFHVELFDNPLYNKNRPLVLDTNILDIGAFPFISDSPFFKTFVSHREVVIPSIVVYELKRKFQISREKRKVIRALMRLQDFKSVNSIKLTISGELSEEAATNELLTQLAIKENKNDKGIKDVRRDVRDSMILLEAIRREAVLFTNDKELRILATLLGVPTISYNSLHDDVLSIVSKLCRERHGKVDKKEIVKYVKEYALRVRDENYRDGDIILVLEYLRQQRREINECLK